MENLINQLTSTHDKDAQVNFLQELVKTADGVCDQNR